MANSFQANSQGRVTRSTIVIDFPGGPDFQFYRLMDANDSQNRWRYTLHWDSIVEYNDTNGNGLFDSSVDAIAKNVSFSTIEFSFAKFSANQTGLNDQVVTGSQMQFYGNKTVESKLFFITINIGWWNDVILHPYGPDFVKVDTSQSKYAINLDNWTFTSMHNRLALLSSIETTTNRSSYDLTSYLNGTVTMITKTDPDGNGKRGGIINNPNMTYIDDTSFEPMKVDFGDKNGIISLQYSFPSFNNSLLYDPTYSAVAAVAGTSSTTTTDKITGVPGFEYQIISLSITGLIIKSKVKKK